MQNMPINIHFFRAGTQGRINYQEVLDYFQDLPNFEILYDNDEVDIIYILKQGFSTSSLLSF